MRSCSSLRSLTIRDQYTSCATRLNIPNRTTTSNLPEHGQNPFQPCPSTRRNRLSKNRKKNNSAARLYPSLECFCTVVGSSSPSSCFSQQKHRKPARRYTALWPRNTRNGSITLQHDQYPATVSFKTASTTERTPNIQNPMDSIGCSCLLLMPPRAHSISAGRPTAPDTAPFPVLHGLLESAKGIAVRCLCLGDFFPHDSGLRSGTARAAASLHPTRSASPGIPPYPTLPCVPHRRSDSDFWVARQGSSRFLLRP